MSEKRLYDVIDKEEPRGQSVSYQGIPCTARHCCTNLNRLTEENEQLKEENEQLKKENQRVYGILEDGGVLLTRKQLLDVIGEDKFDMFFREQATIQSLKEDNEQLKKEYKIAIDEMVTDYKKLEKENEQLRILLKDLYVDDE